MKKVLFFVLALSLASTASWGQRLFDNTFVSFGGGIDFYNNDHTTAQQIFANRQVGYPSLEASFGKWMLNATAVRVGFNAFVADNEYTVPDNGVIGSKVYPFTGTIGDSTGVASSLYYSGHVTLMWDPLTAFGGLKIDRPFSFYPFIGFGVVRRSSNGYSEHDGAFIALGGFSFDFRLHRDFSLYAEPKCFLYPQNYDNNESLSHVFDLTVGLKYDIRRQEYRRRDYGESLFISDDWYFAIGAGANYPYIKGQGGATSVLGELTVGKYFTTCSSVRLQANGGLLAVDNATDTYASLHADMMLDLLNFCQTYLSRMHKNPTLGRGVSPMLYAGAGVYDHFGMDKIRFGMDAGCMLRFYLSRTADLYVDARYALVPRLLSESSATLAEGLPSFTFGYIRNFGQNTLR